MKTGVKIAPYYFSRQKRVFDMALAATLLVVLMPALVLLGVSVLASSGAPVIFRQKRLGRNGRVFVLYKFRTMVKNAVMLQPKYQRLNQAASPMFKIHNDPRFVGVGWLMSHTGLDELPQLWNILRGEMSFVGPRPLPVSEARALPDEWRAWRERVRPGVFSAWARSKKKHGSLDDWQTLEKQTVRRGGLWQDVREIVLGLMAPAGAVVAR